VLSLVAIEFARSKGRARDMRPVLAATVRVSEIVHASAVALSVFEGFFETARGRRYGVYALPLSIFWSMPYARRSFGTECRPDTRAKIFSASLLGTAARRERATSVS
jgi:hypothetical protein